MREASSTKSMPHHTYEQVGQIYRQQAERRKTLAFIDAELSGVANLFKKTATQLENLLTHNRADVESALSRIDMDQILKLVRQRTEVQRALRDAVEELHRPVEK